MKKFKSLPVALALLAATAVGCSQDTIAPDSNNQNTTQAEKAFKSRYIVVLNDDALTLPAEVKSLMAQRPSRLEKSLGEIQARYEKVKGAHMSAMSPLFGSIGLSQEKVFSVYAFAATGFAAELTDAQVAALRRNPLVKYVEADQEVQLEAVEVLEPITVTDKAQTTPYGITNVGGAVNAASLTRWAWVIDSGCDMNHPDLTINTTFARSIVDSTPEDGNGHGTHVSGTIAARNNTIGVIGVAAGATIVPVKVFGASGSSSNAIIVSGIDYVTANAEPGDVANMSLGGGASSTTDNAVLRLAAAGVHCAIAAGNSAVNAGNTSPARVNGTRIYTIAAHDVNNRFASFSNYGRPPVDFSAPGVSVYSTYRGDTYATLSGTSMATPHVAGILLVNNGTIYAKGTVTSRGVTYPRASRIP